MRRWFTLVSTVLCISVFGAERPQKRPSSLQAVFNVCSAEMFGYDDYALCPTAKKYVFASLSLESARAFLEKEFDFKLSASTPQKAAKLITYSMSEQVVSLLEGLEEESKEPVKKFESQIRKLEPILVRAASGRGTRVYTDADTYWAPSVNARAVILIKLEKKSITVIFHGDTDG